MTGNFTIAKTKTQQLQRPDNRQLFEHMLSQTPSDEYRRQTSNINIRYLMKRLEKIAAPTHLSVMRSSSGSLSSMRIFLPTPPWPRDPSWWFFTMFGACLSRTITRNFGSINYSFLYCFRLRLYYLYFFHLIYSRSLFNTLRFFQSLSVPAKEMLFWGPRMPHRENLRSCACRQRSLELRQVSRWWW